MSTSWSTENPNPAIDVATGIVTVQAPQDKVVLSMTTVTMLGISAPLVAADPDRTVVIVTSGPNNNDVAIEPTGVSASANRGIPLNPGGQVTITGVQAQSAMTQFGSNNQVITVYTG